MIARGWRAWAALAFLSIAAVLPGFFSIPPLDRDESRFAQATAQMLETGDFFHIRLQDEPREKKPIGIYWMQAASVALFSDVEKREIWAWRVPSTLGAVLATLATFWAGLALVGRRAAFVGAALLATSVLLSTEGMIAKTDAMLCGATTLAMAALARVHMGQAGWRTQFIFWGALALGVLIKGPITPMVVVLTTAALCVWRRDMGWLRPLATVSGPALAALLLAPWAYALSLSDSGGLGGMIRDIAPKMTGGGEHANRPPGLHLLLLPLLIFPASIGLAPAFVSGWKALRATRDDAAFTGVRFLVAWIVPTWIVFELATTKLVHYTLPVYPAIALLAGAGLLRWLETRGAVRRAGPVSLFLLGSLGIAAACLLTTLWRAPPGVDLGAAPFAVGALCGALLVLAGSILIVTRRPAVVTAVAVVASLALLLTAREYAAPRARHVLVSEAAMRSLVQNELETRTPPLLVIGYREPSLVFAAGTNTMLRAATQAGQDARDTQAVLVEARDRDAFEASLHVHGMAFVPVGSPVAGRNYSNGDDVGLQPGVITAAPR